MSRAATDQPRSAAWLEGVGIALDSVRANKVRAALTILGVAIGVTVVIAMGSAITGINRSITGDPRVGRAQDLLRAALLPGRPRRLGRLGRAVAVAADARGSPIEEAELIRRCPTVRDVNIGEYTDGPVSYEGVNLSSVAIAGFEPDAGSR